MAASTYRFAGPDFVPNNYAANLSNEGAPVAFHLMQNFLASSEIGHALTEPSKLSGSQIKIFWETDVYDDGTVRAALGSHALSTLHFGKVILSTMLQIIGCPGPPTQTEGLKRLQIGYYLLYGLFIDIARFGLRNIDEKLVENRGYVYFASLCQSIFSVCCPEIVISAKDVTYTITNIARPRSYPVGVSLYAVKEQEPGVKLQVRIMHFSHQG